MITKKWWQSKIFWLGIAQILASIAEYIGGLPAGATIVQLVTGILTIVLRFFSNSAIAGTPGAKAKRH
jgi:hypothetical protein